MRILLFLTCVAALFQSGCANQVGKLTVDEFVASADKVELFFEPSTGRNLDPARTDPAAAVLTKKSDITAFCGNLALKRTPPCTCDHFKMMRFSKGQNVLIASFCSHCFDIEDNGHFKASHFEMPKDLWARISKFQQKEQNTGK
jgi:hypothetical protein